MSWSHLPTVTADSAARISPLRFKPSLLLLCCLLLLTSSVAWRRGSYFSGGFDAIVLVKAALTTLAAILAWTMPREPGAWARFRAAPLFWLIAYLTITIVGGLVNGEAFASAVLAARVLLMSVALLFLVISHPWQDVLSALTSAMVLLAAFGSVTGLSSLAETGRLYGGIPPLNANEICLLVSVPAALLFWKAVHGWAQRIEYPALIGLLGVVWLTGARTGLAALIVASMLLIVLSGRLARPLAVLIAAAVPAVLWITFFTPWVTKFASRGDPSNITTLNSRTVAWKAALDYAQTPVERLFGGGLALKQIPVTALYRSSQILDSSWMSAWIQAGILGVAVLALLVLSILWRALRLPGTHGQLIFAVVFMLTVISVLESGLFDSTSSFLTFFTMALCAHQVSIAAEHTYPASIADLGTTRLSRHGDVRSRS